MTADTPNGSELFKKHCSKCHPIAALMTGTPGTHIVEVMRHPKRDMPKFDTDKIPDRDADAIAE
jgi:mono/diheme cytochrome c family protein